jgi:hypothetical protein
MLIPLGIRTRISPRKDEARDVRSRSDPATGLCRRPTRCAAAPACRAVSTSAAFESVLARCARGRAPERLFSAANRGGTDSRAPVVFRVRQDGANDTALQGKKVLILSPAMPVLPGRGRDVSSNNMNDHGDFMLSGRARMLRVFIFLPGISAKGAISLPVLLILGGLYLLLDKCCRRRPLAQRRESSRQVEPCPVLFCDPLLPTIPARAVTHERPARCKLKMVDLISSFRVHSCPATAKIEFPKTEPPHQVHRERLPRALCMGVAPACLRRL